MAKRMRTEGNAHSNCALTFDVRGSSGLALRADVHFSRLLAASDDSLCLVTGGYVLVKAAPDVNRNNFVNSKTMPVLADRDCTESD